jgi:hypothetical protein
MDISMPTDEIFRRWKKRAGRNLKRIKDYNYTYEVSRDREKLPFFYHKMYLPYMVGRFGKLTLLVSFGYMENLLQRGLLLMVKREGEYVSGGFIYTATPTPMFAFLGVKDGRSEHVKQGAISALYYYNILWAKKEGYTTLDFGHSRPILNDGIYQYKKKWGMRIHKSPRKHRTLYLSIGKPKSSLEHFLINTPFIYDDRGKLKGMLFFQRNNQPTMQEVESFKGKYSTAGLEGFTVVLLDNPVT